MPFLKKSIPMALVLSLLLALAACAPAAPEPAAPPPAVEPAANPNLPSAQEPVATVEFELVQPEDPGAKLRTTAAVNDLAAHLDIDPAEIEVVAYEPVTWNDGSLGCPQPDTMYTQALVDGYMIQLRAGGKTYNYHGEFGADPFLCENK